MAALISIILDSPTEYRSAMEYAKTLLCISTEDIDHAIAVLEQSTLYGFSDARFTAMLGGLNYLRKNFSRAEEIFKEAERRKYLNGRKIYFDSKDIGISAEVIAEVSYVGDNHSWLRTNDYPNLRCRTSKFNGVILQEKMRVQIHICFSPREAIAVIDRML